MVPTTKAGFGKLSIIALLLLASISFVSSAKADVIYSENFNSPAFMGSPLPATATSDHWANTNYFYINNADGWTFSNGDYLAVDAGTSDGALLLNENSGPGTASTTISGLTIGDTYTVSFLQWGDNEPGQSYAGSVSVDGTTFNYSGTDLNAGLNPGVLQSFTFVANASTATATLYFGQSSTSAASPIIDNIVVSSVPEPGTLPLLASGLAFLPLIRRRRKTV